MVMRVFHLDPAKLAAPDPSWSPDLAEFVAARYGLRVSEPRDLGGSFTLNVLIDGHVVRVYGPWVSAERVAELQRIRRHAGDGGIPAPELASTLDGSALLGFGDCVLEVERFVTGERMVTPNQLRVGMRTLGRLHGLLSSVDSAVPPPIANHLPQELAVDATLDATAVIRGWNPSPREERYAQIAEDLAGRLPVIDLPSQLVHGDFWDNNVLFRGNELVAVLDFDFAGVRPRVDDLALPLCNLAQAGVGLTELRKLVDAYDAGGAVPLSRDERRALPFAMARMALFFLQYLLLPGDGAYYEHSRREFGDERGPACAWWLERIREGTLTADSFL